MDVQPAPLTQNENEDAIAALRRLVDTRNALSAMQATQPLLGEANAAGARQLLDALAAFWVAQDEEHRESRIALLARYLASAMKEEAALRGFDGTLDNDAVSLVTRATGAVDGSLPTGTHARELMLGNAAHAGSLILVDDASGNALLFTAHGGWEAFDSLERLLEATRRRLLESVDALDGTGIENDAFVEAKAQGSIGSRKIGGAVFARMADRIVEVQAGRIALAADDYGLDSGSPDAATRLGDRIRYELSPESILDIDAIESLREARLLEAVQADRLANVPVDVRDAWYEARDAYNDVLATAAMIRAAVGVQSPLTLHAFASRELATRLSGLDIDESPEAITIDIASIKSLPDALESFDPLPGSAAPRRMSLVDLACQNIGRFSLETLHAMDSRGASLRDRLSAGVLRGMIRDLDIANRYQRHIEERLGQGAVGVLARKLAMAAQAAHIRLEAEEARLSYFLPGEPRTFIDDREERGYRWVDAALGTPAGPRHVANHEIAVSQLTYRQVALDDIIVFGSSAPESAPRIVIYTPGAPDGLAFREFDDRQDAARRFLYHPAFREYLLDRLPAEFATVSSNGARREFAGDRLAHWVLGANRDIPYTQTAEPFDERRVQGDFLAAAHDATVEKYRRDGRFLARTTAGADGDALLAILQKRLSQHPADVAANMLAEVPASVARLAQASWRFYDHVKAGDSGQAFVAFAEGYASATMLMTPPFVGGRPFAAAIVRSRAAARGVVGTGVRLAPPRIRFEDRYAARGLRKPGKPDHEGIFRVKGKAYIEQEGSYFLVRYDANYSRWRLVPSRGAIDAQFTGPLIERIDGCWVYAHDVGLRGGMRRLRERLNRLAVADDAAAPPARPAEPAQQIPLPPAMEPYRAEVTAAMRDNPSVTALVRNDGTNLQMAVRTRSAMIVDPHLHPDIAELSAHQRRTFLHELDARFPLPGERTEVLSIGGWAQQDGRHVPSPPGSPIRGATHGAEVQFPDISSSTGDPAPIPRRLNPGQQRRWDEALAAARSKPRSPEPAASPGTSTAEALPVAEILPHHEWPDRLWYFSDRPFELEPRGAWVEGITLGERSPWGGKRTYPASAMPPETPLRRLSDVMGVSPVPQAGQRDPLGFWMLIDLQGARTWPHSETTHVTPPWGIGMEVRRRLLPSGEYRYTLQIDRPVRVPSERILGIGQRGGRSEQPRPAH